MKKVKVLVVGGLLLLAFAGTVVASTVFTITAAVPSVTSVSITASSVTGTTQTSVVGTALTFGTLTFDTTDELWRAPNYFVIDVANDGAGAPDVIVNYADGAKPANQVHGLGYKGTVAFLKTIIDGTGTADIVLAGHSKKAFKDVVNEHVLPAELSGGWLRMYLGISNGGTDVGEPFVASDRSGNYTGTLTITATAS